MDSYIHHKSVLFPVDGSICHSRLIVFAFRNKANKEMTHARLSTCGYFFLWSLTVIQGCLTLYLQSLL